MGKPTYEGDLIMWIEKRIDMGRWVERVRDFAEKKRKPKEKEKKEKGMVKNRNTNQRSRN
jgi:hypothetical protein